MGKDVVFGIRLVRELFDRVARDLVVDDVEGECAIGVFDEIKS